MRTAVHFGILKRGYKGTDRVLELARLGVPGWKFHVLGVGAPLTAPGIESSSGFAEAADLVAAVERSDATVLPYRRASQSAAVTLSQVLGSVPIATSVGGIPEQITDGVDGLLIPPGSGLEPWSAALSRLSRDRDWAVAMAEAGAARVWRAHQVFVDAVNDLAAR